MSNRCQTRQYKHLELAMLNPHGCPPKKNSFLKQRHICHGQTTVAYCLRDSLATSEANFVVAPKPQTTIEIANKSFLISRHSRAYIKVEKKVFSQPSFWNTAPLHRGLISVPIQYPPNTAPARTLPPHPENFFVTIQSSFHHQQRTN